jgi:hypothetical protein
VCVGGDEAEAGTGWFGDEAVEATRLEGDRRVLELKGIHDRVLEN